MLSAHILPWPLITPPSFFYKKTCVSWQLITLPIHYWDYTGLSWVQRLKTQHNPKPGAHCLISLKDTRKKIAFPNFNNICFQFQSVFGGNFQTSTESVEKISNCKPITRCKWKCSGCNTHQISNYIFFYFRGKLHWLSHSVNQNVILFRDCLVKAVFGPDVNNNSHEWLFGSDVGSTPELGRKKFPIRCQKMSDEHHVGFKFNETVTSYFSHFLIASSLTAVSHSKYNIFGCLDTRFDCYRSIQWAVIIAHRSHIV